MQTQNDVRHVITSHYSIKSSKATLRNIHAHQNLQYNPCPHLPRTLPVCQSIWPRSCGKLRSYSWCLCVRVHSHTVLLSWSPANTIKCTPCRCSVLLLVSVIFCNGAGRVGNYIVRELCCVLVYVKTGWEVWWEIIWLRLWTSVLLSCCKVIKFQEP